MHGGFDLLPALVGELVQAQAEGGVHGVDAAVKHFVARAALDPAVGVFAVDLGQHALFGGDLLEPFARQVGRHVHVAGAGLLDGELAEQQVLRRVGADLPQLEALGPLLALPVHFNAAGRHEDGFVLFAGTLDGAQHGQRVLVLAHPVVNVLRLVGRVDADGRQAQTAAVPGLGVAAL